LVEPEGAGEALRRATAPRAGTEAMELRESRGARGAPAVEVALEVLEGLPGSEVAVTAGRYLWGREPPRLPGENFRVILPKVTEVGEVAPAAAAALAVAAMPEGVAATVAAAGVDSPMTIRQPMGVERLTACPGRPEVVVESPAWLGYLNREELEARRSVELSTTTRPLP
jgi:hypothetical protein